MAADDDLIGTSLVLTLDGQRVTGKVVEAYPDRLVVRVGVKQPAREYKGVVGKAILPDGEVMKFDLGANAFYSEITIDVPREGEGKQTEAPEQERRKFFRMAVELEVEVVENVGFSKEYVRTRGTTINLSGGGMLVTFENALVPGVYKFRLHLPNEVMNLAGKVIRKVGAGSAAPVQFVDITEVERSKLIRVIFNRMRTLKNPEQAEAEANKPAKDGEEPRYARRREKFYKPGKIRYW